ncbi:MULTISPECIES: TetR/AcrR family transcriptional regulator [unclassified Embleya]|uniref:TetR/AcrR family transcriptional regulator n=1 Tax=unclassified Embleya TaxID=2699296 RepID=UPI00340302EF
MQSKESGGDPERPGLRLRKKLATRQRISDVATQLFATRGFDHVTVAEVAEAAGVSPMTVFNHFPRKEDLFLDRIPEAVDLFGTAVRERAGDESPLAALRRMLLDQVEQRHPLSAIGDRFPRFWRVVLDSPALRARAREGLEELEDALAAEVAAGTGAAPDDPRARLYAALVVAAYRSVYVTTAARLIAGESAEGIVGDHLARLNAAFDALERALEG